MRLPCTVQWFLTDNINSIRQLVSSTGSVLDAITYDPYGNIVNQTNSSNAPRFLYTGGAYDSSTRNYQFDARPYSSGDGRFLTEDWKGFSAGNPNLYGYVFNRPLDLTDPSGLYTLGLKAGADPYNINSYVFGTMWTQEQIAAFQQRLLVLQAGAAKQPGSNLGSLGGGVVGVSAGFGGGVAGVFLFGGLVLLTGGSALVITAPIILAGGLAGGTLGGLAGASLGSSKDSFMGGAGAAAHPVVPIAGLGGGVGVGIIVYVPK